MVHVVMASLQEQEGDLEAQIETYRSQLALVKASEGGGGGGEMGQLVQDLQQLIELSEQNLMEMKKQKLLLMLDSSPATPDVPAGGEVSAATPLDEQDEVTGMKCRGPLKESWGGESYHNAIILCMEVSNPEVGGRDIHPPTPEDPQVRILFTHPLYDAMKPCEYFLEGSCKFLDMECNFSHGHVVPLSRLHAYSEPDHSMAHIGGRCLAKHGDGLWYPAIISSVGPEYVVHFPSLSVTSTMPQEDVVPLESEDSSSGSEEGGEGKEGEEDGAVVVEWRPSGSSSALGDWERHTTGIGSRLLAKMGYVVGRGLGKDGQGRVEPVEIVILPAGKSLDVCAQLREENKVKTVDGVPRKKRRKGKKGVAPGDVDKKHADMFEFLNNEVFSTRRNKEEAIKLQKARNTTVSATPGNLNVKLFQVQEEMKALVKRKKSLKESLQRHLKRKDKQLMEQVKEKLRSVESQLQSLQSQEASVQKNISNKSEQKKLAVF